MTGDEHYDLAAIRAVVTAAFDDPGLDAFCMDCYPAVWETFSRGLRKDEKITLLLDYAQRHEGLGELMARLRRRGLPVLPRAPGSAPPAPALFVGRAEAVRELKARLGMVPGQEDVGPAAPVQVMTAVRGWPGVGKTTLAAALAHDGEIAATLPDGVLWVALGPDPDVMTGLADWGRALGVDLAEYPTPEARSARLAHLLRDQRRLLIVDDVWPDEHDQPSAARPFCVGGTGCRTLVTTRHADLARTLASRADAVYRLGVLDDAAARELLVELAGPAVNTSALDELIHALDGLPLALTVAGRLLAAEASMGWGLNDLLGELQQRECILSEPTCEPRPGLLTDVPLTVAAILQLSTDRLPAEVRARFAMLGAFAPKPATWDVDGAGAVWETEDARPTLRLLVDRGLVEPAGAGRFHLHAMLTEHARAMVRADLPAVADRHAHHYLAVAESTTAAQQFLSLDTDWPQLRAALEYAYADNPRLLSDLVSALNDYLNVRSLIRDWLIWCKRAATASRVLGDRYGEGAHLTNQGIAYAILGEPRRAIDCYRRAQPFFDGIGDKSRQGSILGNLGNAYNNLGEVRQAVTCYEKALAIAREIEDEGNKGTWLGNLGQAYNDLGDYDQAIDHLQQALNVHRRIGDRRGEGSHLGNLGIAYARTGRYDQAIEHFQQALSIFHEIGDRQGESNILGNLGNTSAILGKANQAIEYYDQVLTIHQEIGDQRGEALTCWNLGLLYEKQGDQERAAELMQVRVDYERKIGHPDAEAHAAIVAQVREGKLAKS